MDRESEWENLQEKVRYVSGNLPNAKPDLNGLCGRCYGCSMVTKKDILVNWDPVERDAIGVYNVPGQTHPTVMLEVEGVQVTSPFEETAEIREYTVEVEFVPDGLTLDEGSFIEEYLRSYKEVKVSQESMTRAIRNDLRHALGIEDVFVRVTRGNVPCKQTWIGAP